ncbi:MAG: plasmid mobilization protein [Solirubrobacterales bacterium]
MPSSQFKKQVQLRLAPVEHALIEEAARLEGLPTTTWIRRAALLTARKVTRGGK